MVASDLLFQSPLQRIAAESPPAALRLTVLAAAAFFAALLTIASVAQVDIVVSGRGRLATDHPTNVVMPVERAILRSLLVRPGDKIVKGELLATLDSTVTAADLAAAEAEVRSLRAESGRLRAELAGQHYPAGSGSEADLQSHIQDSRLRELTARRAELSQAVARDTAEREAALHQITSLRTQLTAATEMRKLREALMRRAEGSRLQYLSAVQEESRLAAALHAAQDQPDIIAHSLASDIAQRNEFESQWRRMEEEALSATETHRAAAEAALQKARQLQELVSITAPEDGIVLSIAERGPGAVLRDAEPLLTLLPAHAALTAEVAVKSGDLGYLRSGEAADVKIEAYPYQRHGTLHGAVRSIAAASIDQADGTATHRVIIDLPAPRLALLPAGVGPIPGMTITADMHVGRRSILAYFLSPVTRGLAQSFREPG